MSGRLLVGPVFFSYKVVYMLDVTCGSACFITPLLLNLEAPLLVGPARPFSSHSTFSTN